jgi:hypothetical protein
MDRLIDDRREKFCQLIALEDCDPSDAAFRAGYGEKYNHKCSYHTICANRLLSRDDVALRINTIRQQNADEDLNYKETLIKTLKRAVAFNPLKYYSSNNVTLPNGRTVTDIYLKRKVQDWNPEDYSLVLGFDSRGLPKYIDKQWAIEKLLKIYGIDGSNSVDIEDLLSLFAKAGLPTGGKDTTDMDEFEDELSADIGEDE